MTSPHVLLTRFNIPANGIEKSLYSDSWLRERVELFLRYTVPSVRRQTVAPAGWVLLCDHASPQWMWDELQPLVASGLIQICRLDGPLGSGQLEELVRACLVPGAEHVVTSNLDNDDAITLDFIERAGAALTDSYDGVVFDEGLIRQGSDLYLVRDRRNPFIAVRSTVAPGKLRTCWIDWHNSLDQHFSLRHVPGVAWLQVVHGRNVTNRVRGTLTDAREHVASMPWAIADIASPSASRLAMERALRGPFRIMRGRVRSVVIRGARATLGNRRFDIFKARMKRAGR